MRLAADSLRTATTPSLADHRKLALAAAHNDHVAKLIGGALSFGLLIISARRLGAGNGSAIVGMNWSRQDIVGVSAAARRLPVQVFAALVHMRGPFAQPERQSARWAMSRQSRDPVHTDTVALPPLAPAPTPACELSRPLRCADPPRGSESPDPSSTNCAPCAMLVRSPAL